MNKKKQFIKRCVPCIIIMGLIFIFSAMPATKSDATSHFFADPLAQLFQLFGIDMISVDLREGLNWFVRKAAHASEYAVLAAFVAHAVSIYCKRNDGLVIVSQLICMIYAMSDEFHQLFVTGRHAAWTDVAIDSTGAIVGIIFYLLIFTWKIKKKEVL